jgi:tRNA (cmo5U34)-methyltransferase
MSTNVKASELNYNTYSKEQYDKNIVQSIPGHKELHKIIEAKTKTLKIKKMLDLGVGTGLTTKIILRNHKDAECTVIDFSETMLKSAKKQLKNYKVRFIKADYAKQPIPKENDLIVSVIGLHHQKNLKRMFKKIYKALKPKGVFIFGDLVTYKDKKEAALNEALHYNYLVEQHSNKQQLKEWAHHHKFLNDLRPLEDQIQWLEQVGFKVKVEHKMFNTVLIRAKK